MPDHVGHAVVAYQRSPVEGSRLSSLIRVRRFARLPWLINATSSNASDTKVSPIPSSYRFAFMLLA